MGATDKSTERRQRMMDQWISEMQIRIRTCDREIAHLDQTIAMCRELRGFESRRKVTLRAHLRYHVAAYLKRTDRPARGRRTS